MPLAKACNGHNFIEHQLRHAKIGFRKNDNAFVAVDDVAVLQAAADKLSPDIIRSRLDYWTFILGPKFSAKERKQVKLSRIYAAILNANESRSRGCAWGVVSPEYHRLW
jgi:hypothetical protein